MNIGRWNYLGGHLDTTPRGRAGTISGRIRKESIQLAAVGALPFGIKEKLQFLRTKSEPPALHGSEASPISKTDMKSLRTAFCCAACSSKVPIGNTGAIL